MTPSQRCSDSACEYQLRSCRYITAAVCPNNNMVRMFHVFARRLQKIFCSDGAPETVVPRPSTDQHTTAARSVCRRCGMVVSRADLASPFAALELKQHAAAFVAAAPAGAAPRRRRVRQRGSSSCALQQTACRSPPSSRSPSRQPIRATADCPGSASGTVAIGGRHGVGPGKAGGSSTSTSSGRTTGGNDVLTSRNRMTAAAKRGRWIEASFALVQRKRLCNNQGGSRDRDWAWEDNTPLSVDATGLGRIPGPLRAISLTICAP